jgi:hypothetical protein
MGNGVRPKTAQGIFSLSVNIRKGTLSRVSPIAEPSGRLSHLESMDYADSWTMRVVISPLMRAFYPIMPACANNSANG